MDEFSFDLCTSYTTFRNTYLDKPWANFIRSESKEMSDGHNITTYYSYVSKNNKILNLRETEISIKDGEILSAKKYIESNQNKDLDCVEILKYIIHESTKNPYRVISSKEIKNNLQLRGIEIGDPISKISLLRSHRVVIISPQGKKGYKFPTSEKEIADFYDRLRDNVIPQLKRCLILNNVLQEMSLGKYGVLKHDEYKLLNHLCEIVNNQIQK